MPNSSNNAINKWWLWIRPYWHVLSFIVLITYVGTMKWAVVEGYAEKIAKNDTRIIALEQWQFNISQDIATTRQEVHDLHEYFVPRKTAMIGAK